MPQSAVAEGIIRFTWQRSLGWMELRLGCFFPGSENAGLFISHQCIFKMPACRARVRVNVWATCVRASVRACVRASVRRCVRACVGGSVLDCAGDLVVCAKDSVYAIYTVQSQSWIDCANGLGRSAKDSLYATLDRGRQSRRTARMVLSIAPKIRYYIRQRVLDCADSLLNYAKDSLYATVNSLILCGWSCLRSTPPETRCLIDCIRILD